WVDNSRAEQSAAADRAGMSAFRDMTVSRPARLLSCGVRVRHEVADVAVLKSADRLTAPAVLPAVSYRDRKPRDNVTSSFGRVARARAVTTTTSSTVVGNQDGVGKVNPGEVLSAPSPKNQRKLLNRLHQKVRGQVRRPRTPATQMTSHRRRD